MNLVVLDAQPVSALADRRRSASLDRARAVIAALIDQGATPVIPATVIAEVRRGRRSPAVDRVLNHHRIVPVDRVVASAAGLLLDRTHLSSAHLADAVVAAVATSASGSAVIVTSDPDDLRRLTASHGDRIAVIGV